MIEIQIEMCTSKQDKLGYISGLLEKEVAFLLWNMTRLHLHNDLYWESLTLSNNIIRFML